MNKEIGIVVVLYKPNKDHLNNVLNLAKAFRVYVIDNSEDSCTISHTNMDYIPLYENKGIAFAQNVGIKRMQTERFEYVLFLDQDSRISSDQILQLKDDYEFIYHTIDENIGCVSPTIINEDTGIGYKSHERMTSSFTRQQFVISSGMLIPVNVICKIGYVCEGLFIDFVDHELCFRLKEYGYSIYSTNKVCLKHKIGNGAFFFLGQEIIVSKPFRYYFKYRNFIWLIKTKYIPYTWKIKSSILLLLEVLCILFDSHYKNIRRDVLRNLFKGIKDGIKQKCM